MSKATSIRFNDNLYQEMVDYTTLNGQSVSSFVEEAVSAYIAEKGITQPRVREIHQFMDQYAPLMEKLKDR
ncbi:hypothetical protein [Pseudolactococcus insecticola]|uniref:Uncharacterized protein n=1 Tax=Pseudolactococcus insecticola TaxID=2709158 RepID=A0A6A0B3W9_9LACT|nr:hypothetical protein [Lactococcus insecticola]GFH40039.1 hypothetical protein Hs20B_04370 [Lactococcus insecticola]